MSSDEENDQNQTFTTMASELGNKLTLNPPAAVSQNSRLSGEPINIASISSGFEQSDFLVRESKGQRVYFDFFEEAFNYLANKGYAKMNGDALKEWMDIIESAHRSIPDGTTYRTGTLIMVMSRPVSYTHADHSGNNNNNNNHTNKNGAKVESMSSGSVRKSGIQGIHNNEEDNESLFV